MNNKKGNSPLLNGIILGAILIYLCYYFTINSMWNIATVFVAILIATIAVGQVMIYMFLFRDKKK